MSKLPISALEEQWDVLEQLHYDLVQFWSADADPQVGRRFRSMMRQLKWADLSQFTPRSILFSLMVFLILYKFTPQPILDLKYCCVLLPIKICGSGGGEIKSWAEKKKAEARAKQKVFTNCETESTTLESFNQVFIALGSTYLEIFYLYIFELYRCCRLCWRRRKTSAAVG